MTIVRVAIPLKRGKRKFFLDKGRPWTVIEHILLWDINVQARTVSQLSSRSNLPRRLIIEAVIRLMRAGFLVLSQGAEGVVFSISVLGRSVVSQTELPYAPKRISRSMNFLIDQITGTIYRGRELPFFERHVVEERAKREKVVWLKPREFEAGDDAAKIVATLFNSDERFISMDPAGDRFVDRFAVVTVRDGRVEGLPQRAPFELQEIVLSAAAEMPTAPGSTPSVFDPGPSPSHVDDAPDKPLEVVFHSDDVVLGGPAHRELFERILRRARCRIIIHSTFINADSFNAVRPALFDAVKRGARVDVFWGEDEEKVGSKTTKIAIDRLRLDLAKDGLDTAIVLHPFSTRSHSKLIVADTGQSSQFVAVVGSCNWLSTGFQAFEASIYLRDPRMVSLVVEELAELSKGGNGHWTDLTNELIRLSIEIRSNPIPSGVTAGSALVLGPQHAQYVRLARDEATSRLFVTSHRLGAATRPAVIVPAIAAAEARGIQANIFYGRTSGRNAGKFAADIVVQAAAKGVQVQPVHEPRLHAKFLAWDNDDVLITSQNWLSADPSEANPRREIGIYIHANGIARTVIDRFKAMQRG